METAAAPPPFKPQMPHLMLARFRAALVKIYSPEAAERNAIAEPAQIFDFAEEVRLVLTVQEGIEGNLVIVIYAQAVGDRAPLAPSDMPLVIWLFKRITLLHTLALHVYHDGHRVIATYAAPPGSGEPLPPEPVKAEPPKVADEPKAAQVTVEVEIPPSLRAHRSDEIKAKIV